MRYAVVLASCALLAGCDPTVYLIREPPKQAYDTVIVLGCPSEADGSPSRCTLGRAGQAALLWKHGFTKSFIVSGSAVHTPYVEAEAIAQAMETLDVPADKIWLEEDALHTDENVFYGMKLADDLGLTRVAIASHGAHAAWACSLMVRWGRPCGAFAMDEDELGSFLPPRETALRALRARRVDGWVPLGEREARIAAATGFSRPPSYLLYPMLGMGLAYTPRPVPRRTPIAWADVRPSIRASTSSTRTASDGASRSSP
jgi:hypothetical protein